MENSNDKNIPVVMVDTNVIIDFYSMDEGRNLFRLQAEEFIRLVAMNEVKAYITATSVTTLYYMLHKLTHSKRVTEDCIEKTLKLFGVLDVKESDCVKALTLNNGDYEDGVQICSAIRHKMDCIITRNEKLFVNQGIEVHSPVDFVNMMNGKSRTIGMEKDGR